MSLTQKQALLRFGRVLISALVAAGATGIPELMDAFVLDPFMRSVIMIVVTAGIEAALKLVGGATQALHETKGRAQAEAEKPSWLSV